MDQDKANNIHDVGGSAWVGQEEEINVKLNRSVVIYVSHVLLTFASIKTW